MPAESDAQRRWAFGVKGPAWAKRHHFDNKGPLPERATKETLTPVHIAAIEPDARAELDRFWAAHPALRAGCVGKYGHDPVDAELSYWRYGLAEPEHADVREHVVANGGTITLADVKRWEPQELREASVSKASVPDWAHLRESTEPGVSCSTCDFFDAVHKECEMFEGHPPVEPGEVCDKWAHRVDKEGQPTSGSQRAFDPAEVRGMAELVAALEPTQVEKADVKAAGIAVRAADSGRVLMIQRCLDAGDPAAGTWEFPGGNLNEGEHPYAGAKREWQEEMGIRLPKGDHAGQWRSGIYQGFIHEVPSEDRVPINRDHEDRRVLNPDDPDGDQIEVAAWFHPDQLKRMSSLRPELRDSRPWRKVQKSDITAGPGTGVELIRHGAGALYLVSHAKTRYNRPGQPHDIVHGWRNTPLDSAGHRQARKLGRFLKSAGIEELHSSDLARARQTADAIADATGLTPHVATKYRPWNLGNFAGHSSADVVPKLKGFMHDSPAQPVDGGESFDSFKGRFIPALETLLKRAEAGKTVALVTHSRNVELAQGWLEGRGHRKQIDTRAISEDRLDPATVIRVSRGRDGRMAMEELADETIRKGTARAAELRLRVHGVSTTPSGMRVYRMVTRDGHYVGRTNATRVRARKGDVLKVAANDLAQDSTGDLRWMNPNVVGAAIHDTPHSWRELEAMAGGLIDKDGADGPGGDLPSAEGDTPPTRFPSGPTLASVHVDAPLPNISVAYANRRLIPNPEQTVFRVAKADKMKQLVYGVVLAPNELDSQNDYMLPDAVEKTAHGFLKRSIRGTNNVHKLQHRRKVNVRGGRPSLIPVESFVAPVDFTYDGKETIKKGSWVLVVHVEDPGLWQDFLNGKYNAFSVGGYGRRSKMSELPGQIPGSWMRGQAEVYAGRLAARRLNSFV